MGNLVSAFTALLLLIACGKTLPTELQKGQSPGEKDPEQKTSFLEGTLTNTEGTKIILQEFRLRPLVLIFAQEFCQACLEESQELVQEFQKQNGIPQNIDLLTVLVFGDNDEKNQEYAQEFKQSLGIPWTVSFQNENGLFKTSCPSRVVPCVVVQTPTKGLVFQKTGKFQIEELEKYTGSWSYR